MIVAAALDPRKQRKPMRKAKPSVAAAQYAQRRALTLRSGSRCEAEYETVIAGDWTRCIKRATVAAHIFPRGKCGAARDLIEAVINTCAAHNIDHFDGRVKGIRAPLRFAQAAYDKIIAVAKDKESARAVLGPRPEPGTAPYD